MINPIVNAANVGNAKIGKYFLIAFSIIIPMPFWYLPYIEKKWTVSIRCPLPASMNALHTFMVTLC